MDLSDLLKKTVIGVGTPCHLIILHNIHIYFNMSFFHCSPDFYI